MTIDEVIAELKKTPRTWRLQQRNSIPGSFIRNQEDQCPLGAVCDMWGALFDRWMTVAVALGLEWTDANAIMQAADDHGDAKLRSRLLEACGL